MATETKSLVTSNVDPDVAAAMRLHDQLAPLKNALGAGDLTDAELQLFAMVAHRSGLDPFARQIYAVKRGGKVTFQDGIDGHRAAAERTRQYAGSEEATYEECTCGASDSPAQHPAVARVVVHRIMPGGRVIDQVGIARWHELKPNHVKPGNAHDYLDAMWWRMPYNQLAKCAEANGLRKAFPKVLGQIYITEEMEQAGPAENGALVEAAAKPTAKERLAARRAAVEAEAIEGDVVEFKDVSADAPANEGDQHAEQPAGAEAEPRAGLTLAEFTAWLDTEGIGTEYAKGVRETLFPGGEQLTDEQRARLRDEIVRLGQEANQPLGL